MSQQINPRLKVLLGSKTVWGAILGAGAWLLAQPHMDATTIFQAIGAVITAIGARDAITTSNQPQPQSTPATDSAPSSMVAPPVNSGGSGA